MKNFIVYIAVILGLSINCAYASKGLDEIDHSHKFVVFNKVFEIREALQNIGNNESFIGPVIRGNKDPLLSRFNHRLLEQVLIEGVCLKDLFYFDTDAMSKLDDLMMLLNYVEMR